MPISSGLTGRGACGKLLEVAAARVFFGPFSQKERVVEPRSSPDRYERGGLLSVT